MDINNLKGLMEAYQQVNAPIDEAEKPFPHEKVKAKQVALRDKGGNALDRIMKMGMAVRRAKEAEKTGGSQRDAGKGWYHAKEELEIFDVVLEFLQAEGYAETLEEAEWMMANIIDEEAIAIIAEASCEDDEEEMKKGKKSKKSEEDDEEDEEDLDEALTGDRAKKAIKKPGGMAYTRMVSADPAKRATRGGRGGESDFGAGDRGSGNRAARRAGRDVYDTRYEAFEAWLDEAMSNYEKNRKRAAQRAAARNAARDQGKTGAVPGVGYVTPRRERETWTDESGKTRHAKGL